MSNLPEQFKINLNQNLWGLVVAFGALGASERFQLPTLFWFAIFVSLIMALSIATTTLAYSITYWKKKADGGLATYHDFGSPIGWRRVWVLCSLIAIFPVIYFVLPSFPTATALHENHVVESIEATETFLANSQGGYKPLGAQVVRTQFYADLPSEEIISRLHERYKGKVDFSKIEELHNLRLAHLSSDQLWIAGKAIIFWGTFSVLILVFGLLVRWVYQGFREST